MTIGRETSWEKVHDWYDDIVGREGHFYHQHVIIPHLLPFISRAKKVLDVGCGQGILSRHLSKETIYVGIDNSPTLLAKAKKICTHKHAVFLMQDATCLSLKERDFSHAVFLLSLQNMADPFSVLHHAADHLLPSGELILVLNHPCFRIPRQSGWEIDEKKQLQSRRVDRYMSPLKIPIFTRPSQQEKSTSSLSYHFPLSIYSEALSKSGFSIYRIEEWCSDKKSSGRAARRENRARLEFPLFMTIVARRS